MWMETLPVEPLNKLIFPAQIWSIPARIIRPGNPGKLKFHLKGFCSLIRDQITFGKTFNFAAVGFRGVQSG